MKIDKDTAKNIKLTILYSTLTLGLVFLIFRFGLSVAVDISEYLQKNKPGNEETPLDSYLAQPKFFGVTEATNSAQFPIKGYGPANKEVAIFLNEVEDQALPVNSEGVFEGELKLTLGINKFYAIAKDFTENTSAKSEIQSIYYSDSPPLIEIEDPSPDSVIKNNPSISIKGKTESNSKLYINDHVVLVNSDGSFSYPVKLEKGDNIFKIVAIDPAQNTSEKDFKLQFRP